MGHRVVKTCVRDATSEALVGRLSDADHAVEIGIGNRVAIARDLSAAGVQVTATDVRPRTVPDEIHFVRDDVTNPDRALYVDADVIYALNLPPELHQPAATLADRVDAEFYFTTLGGDPPTIPVSRETIPGETVFLATDRDPATPSHKSHEAGGRDSGR
jgi:uncharacterized UPF0146 family protein